MLRKLPLEMREQVYQYATDPESFILHTVHAGIPEKKAVLDALKSRFGRRRPISKSTSTNA